MTEKKVVLLSPAGGDVLLLDRETENLTVYGDYPEELNSIGAKGQAEYRSGCEDQQYYYYLVGKTRYILKIDKLNGNLSWVQLQLPTAQERYEYYLQHQEFSFLEKNIPVKTLLENVKKEERTQLPKSRIGETIWKVLNQE